MKLDPYFTYTNINSKWVQDLNEGAETIKLVEGSTGVNLHDPGLGALFLDVTPKA